MEVLFAAHFMPDSEGTAVIKEDARNREVDLAFLENHSSYFASFAYQQCMKNGPGCVKIEVEEIVRINRELKRTGGGLPSTLYLSYLSATEHFPAESFDPPQDARDVPDQLRFTVEALVHSYDPATEYVMLLTQEGGPYRLYRLKPKVLPPESLGAKMPHELN